MGGAASGRAAPQAEHDNGAYERDPIDEVLCVIDGIADPFLLARLGCVCRGLSDAVATCDGLASVREVLHAFDESDGAIALAPDRRRRLRWALGGAAAAVATADDVLALVSTAAAAARLCNLFPPSLRVLGDGAAAADGTPAPALPSLAFLARARLTFGGDAGFSLVSAGDRVRSVFDDEDGGPTGAEVRRSSRQVMTMLGDHPDSCTAFCVAVEDSENASRGDVIASPLRRLPPPRARLGLNARAT